MISRFCKRISFLFAFCMLLAASNGLYAEETVGERFRKVMAQIDAQCKKDKIGPYLDPSDPRYQEKRRQTQCDVLTLKPYDPLATEEGRFAHSIKLPPPHDKLKNVWRDGMTGEEYFKALCEAEAGEWVFKKVDGVEGVRQLRPVDRTNYYGLLGVYFASEGAGIDFNGSKPEQYLVSPVGTKHEKYSFIEIPDQNAADDKKFLRFFRNSTVPIDRPPYGVDVKSVSVPQSKFGYVWRGAERPHARENGVLGAELLIVDLKTNIVLAFRRSFVRFYFDPHYVDPRQMWPANCPNIKLDGSSSFITRILKPTGDSK